MALAYVHRIRVPVGANRFRHQDGCRRNGFPWGLRSRPGFAGKKHSERGVQAAETCCFWGCCYSKVSMTGGAGFSFFSVKSTEADRLVQDGGRRSVTLGTRRRTATWGPRRAAQLAAAPSAVAQAAPATQAAPMRRIAVEEAFSTPELMAAPTSQLRVQFSRTEWNRVKQRAERDNVPVTRYVKERLLESL